jgi:outer membrane protein OmpU
MNKLLLASSVLALTATTAMADVTLSGDGRFGVRDNGAGAAFVEGRTRVNFGLSATGDHGLTFGGTLRLSQSYDSVGVATGATTNGSVFIGANGFRLTYGDIDGAVARRVAIYGGGLGYTGRVGRPATHANYLEGDNGAVASVRADYDINGFGISLAAAQGVANDAEIAVSYSASGMSVAAGYEEGGNWSISPVKSASTDAIPSAVTPSTGRVCTMSPSVSPVVVVSPSFTRNQ